MKRKFFRASWMLALAGLVAFSFVGTSCGDDDDEEPVNNNQQQQGGQQQGGEQQGGQQQGGEQQGGQQQGGEQQGNGKNHYIVVDVPAMEANPWDSQFWIYLGDQTVAEGDDVTVSMKVKADVETPNNADGNPCFGLQWHAKPSDYAGKWQPLEFTETVGAVPEKGYMSITWNLNNFAEANKYYFDDISVKVNGVEKVKNGNMEGTDFSSFYKKELNTDTDPVVVPETSVKEE